MNPEVTARHFQLAEGLKQRTEERLAKLQRFFDPILEARVVVTFERNRYDAEAIVVANGTRLTGNAVADSDRAALDLVLDKLEMQVRRHKDRLVRGRRKGGEPREREAAAPAAEGEEDFSARSRGTGAWSWTCRRRWPSSACPAARCWGSRTGGRAAPLSPSNVVTA
jgi:ribosomal subunit interface protein